jgi:hypothetical protein
MKYTTATELKMYPSIPDNANEGFLDKLIERASAYISLKTNRSFGYNTDDVPFATVTDEVYTTAEWGGVYLKQGDVQAITSLKVGVNDTIYLPADYTFDKSIRRLYVGGAGVDIKVSYTYGYAGVPDDIKYATEQLVIAMFLGGSTETGQIVSERTGNYQVSYASPSSAAKSAPDVGDIITQYRLIHI